MTKRSGLKGGEFERLTAKFLNKVYETEEFTRTPGSGALMGMSNFAKRMGLSEEVRRTLGSDLIVPEWFPYSVECKWYKADPNYSTIIKDNDSMLDLWLGEAVFDAINFDAIPMLVFKTNNQGIHYAIPTDIISMIVVTHKLMYNEFTIIGERQFAENAQSIVEAGQIQKTDIMKWLEQSPYIRRLLDNLMTKKSNRRNKNK